MRDYGQLCRMSGIKVARSKKEIALFQKKAYTTHDLEASMLGSRTMDSPMGSNSKLVSEWESI